MWARLCYQWSYSGTSKSSSDWRAAEGPQNLVSRWTGIINTNKCKRAQQVGETLSAQLTIRTAWKTLQKKLHHEPSSGYQTKKTKKENMVLGLQEEGKHQTSSFTARECLIDRLFRQPRQAGREPWLQSSKREDEREGMTEINSCDDNHLKQKKLPKG